MKTFKFKGGTHPPERKKQSKYQNIEKLPQVEYVYIPINKNVKRLVKIGEYVKVGQVIAYSDNESYIHSSVSGEVIDVEKMRLTDGREEKVIKIKNDFSDTWEVMKKHDDYSKLTKEDLVKIVQKAGILGMGGAMFPAFRKLNIQKPHKFNILIANGAECEPYLNADNRLMQEKSKEIIEGIKIIKEVYNIEKCIIGIEEDKKEAIFSMKKSLKNEDKIEIAVLKTMYPQGGERQLIKALTNVEIPKHHHPFEFEMVMFNVATLFAIYEAVVLGKASVERVVTVAGEGVEEGKNFRVKIGTLVKDLLTFVQYDSGKADRIIIGGPMTGFSQVDTVTPILKGNNGVLALSNKEMRKAEKRSCIYCSSCVRRCPMGLIPLEFDRLVELEEYQKLLEFNIFDCIECGVCSYTCPSSRPILEAIRFGKAKIKELNLHD